MFEYYTFLHHSQTGVIFLSAPISLNTIRFYIILKPFWVMETRKNGLNTIRLYIILKPLLPPTAQSPPFEYYTFLHHSQTIHYHSMIMLLFEYYTFLHHSQTGSSAEDMDKLFEYYTFLHHSQTSNSKMKCLTRTYVIVSKQF